MLTRDQINKLKRAKGLILSVCNDVEEQRSKKVKTIKERFLGTSEENFLEVMLESVMPSIDAAIEGEY